MTRVAVSSSGRRAFTLVEVLATLTLAAIILPVAMKGISLATAASGETRRKLEAATLAEGELAELLATGEWEGADLSGDFGEDRPGYRWYAEVSDWDGAVLKQVTVHVEWTARGRQRDVSLTTLVYAGGQ